MKQLWTCRRLFIGFIAILACVYKPEIASFVMTIALGVAAANSTQAIMAREKGVL